MVIAKKYVLARKFEGEPKPSDFSLVEEKLPALKSGGEYRNLFIDTISLTMLMVLEFLVKAVYLSVDPYVRLYGDQQPLGSTIIGSQIAEVVTSKNKRFPIGKRILANVGWRTYTVMDGSPGGAFNQVPYILPDFGGLHASVGLGVLGMPG